MGYDNECIVNIQSLAGEYFCPVCRTLVYPNEALQSQCTHLYCKPCLAYVVATTHACPYDGFLVTEADSKPLVESNKELGETIGKVAVYCLFHRSGCQWQGTLAESTAHCAGCNYGNSPVVCNRCGTQIVHRQVQEHAQICPGIQPQAQPQQVENQQAQASSFPNQSSADAAATSAASTGTVATTAPSADAVHSATVSSASASVPAAASATSGPAQAQAQGGAVVYPQAPAQGQTPEQWYQQQQQLQYQQYYQQYPGYDPYQQQYQQQYAQYQQQPGYPQHVQPPMQAAAPQHVQPQPYLQPQPQAQPQLQAVQPQVQQPHHPQPQPHLPAQVPPMQAPQPQQMPPPQQLYPHSQPQAHLPPHGHVAGQAYPQPQPHATHARPPQLPGPPLQHQQQPMPPPQQLQQQMPHPHPHPQHGPRPQHPPSQPQKPPTQMQPQPQPHSHAPPVPQMQSSNPPAHAVSGFQSYPQSNPGIQQQQRPMQMHHPLQQGIPTQQHVPPQGQFPHQQPSQMRPPHSQMPMPAQQPLGMPPPLGPPPNLYPPQQVQHLAHQSVQQAYQQPGLPHQQIHAQQPMRPQGAPYMQQPVPGHPHHQGLPPNQSHSRPMMQQPGPQSPGAAHNKFMQLGMTQQSPNQSSVGKSTSLLASSEQQSQHPHSGSHGGQFSGPKQGASTPDKVSQIPPEATKSGENSKHMGDEGKGTVETEKDAQVEKENKVLSESLVKEENMGQPLLKQVKEEEGANILSEFQGQDNKPDDKSGSVKGDEAHSVLEGTPMVQNQPGSDKVMHGESQNIERPSLSSVTGNPMHPAQHLPPPGVLDRGQVQKQPTQENIHPVQGGANPHPGFNERNPTHFPQQYTGPDDRRGMPPGGPQQQQIPYGHPPHMPDPTIMLQRPAPPDRMLPQPMPQSSQERRFPEPPPHQVHMQGQTVPPSHMRPPGHNASDAFAHQGTPAVPQEPFWPPPHAGVPAQNLPPPPGRGPGLHGFPPKGFEQQAMGPAQGQTHLMPPPHAGGARPPPGDPSPWPVMGGPPPGDPSSRIVGGPPFTPSDRVEVETHGIKRPGAYDGRQLEPHRPLLSDGALYGQPNVLKNNGMLNNAPVGGMHEDRFRPMPEERFKPFHEEGYKAHPDEHFRPPMLDPGRHIADRREFEEDLKQFPRPAYLDGDGPRFDGYLSSSRPLDRMAGVNVPPSSRPLPNIGSSEFHPDIGDRDRPILFHDHLVRKHDGPIAHPDRSNLVSEFGRHRLDNLPPFRSPGHFGGEFPDRLPGHLRRGMDGHGPLGHSLPSDLRGSETMDSQNLPSFSRGGSFGGFRSHVGIGELGGPGNMPLHLRGSREGDMDPFEQSRKRKMGNMVRCLICKIDCDTIEGLEVHSQTREHQKMAMDVVLSIKKDNAKKHKLTADNATSFEGANKPRKAGFEKRGNRQ